MTITYQSFPTVIANTSTPLIGPSYPVDVKRQPKILSVNFGDGYTQQTPDGLNYNLRVYNVTWEVLISTELMTIEAFLNSMGGYQTFQWTNPIGQTILVKCPSWNSSNINPGSYSLQATFNEVPI